MFLIVQHARKLKPAMKLWKQGLFAVPHKKFGKCCGDVKCVIEHSEDPGLDKPDPSVGEEPKNGMK